VKTNRYADSQTASRLSLLQSWRFTSALLWIYNLFVSKVAQGQLPEQKVAQIAQGRVWSGLAAKEIGLVDEIGGLDAAIQYAAKQAKLGEDWELQEYPEVRTFEQRLLGQLTRGQKCPGSNPLDNYHLIR